MRFSPAMLVCLLISMQANSESLDFALYHLSGEERALIAEGMLDYTVNDIEVKAWEKKDGHPTWKKSLKLKEGFSLGVLVVQDESNRGFGLWIQNDQYPDGFSWEWFEPEDGDIYRKLQGEGHVRVTQTKTEDGVALQSVEFLADITLRFLENVKMELGSVTHEVVVHQGSVLRVAH